MLKEPVPHYLAAHNNIPGKDSHGLNWFVCLSRSRSSETNECVAPFFVNVDSVSLIEAALFHAKNHPLHTYLPNYLIYSPQPTAIRIQFLATLLMNADSTFNNTFILIRGGFESFKVLNLRVIYHANYIFLEILK